MAKKQKPIDEKLASDWWHADGRFIDPDESSVPWYDKRHLLAQMAYCAGYNAGLARKGADADPRLKDALPLVMYFNSAVDRDEFVREVEKAKPNMTKKKWP